MAGAENVHVEVLDDDGSAARTGKKRRKVSWPLLIAGILLIVLGLACIVWPGSTLETIGLLMGIGFLVSGCLGIVDFFATGGFAIFSGWLLFDGIIGILLGSMFLAEPFASGAALSWLIGIIVACGGIVQIVSAVELRRVAPGIWGLVLLTGILTVFVGLAFFADPGVLSVFLGLFAIFYGAVTIAGAVKIPKIFG